MEVREPSARYLVVQTGRGHPDWENVKLGAIASFRTGPFGTSLHKSDYVLGGVPVVNPMQIEDGRIKPTDRMSVAEQAADRLGEFRLKAGDVVIGRRGEMGRCAFVQDEQEGWLCGTGSMIVRPGAKLDGRFLQRVLSSNQAARAIESASVGTTMINLNQRTLADLSLHIPISIKEQAAIADALTATDALIDSLEQLLTKKRQIKQGAMQELLTGKRRLPGFTANWATKRIGDLLAIRHGRSQKTVECVGGDFPILATGGQIGWASAYLHVGPSVLIGRKGTIDQPRYMDSPFWSVDTLFYSDVFHPNVAKFLYYRFCLIDWMRHNEASGVPSLGAKVIESIEIACPDATEQEAIAKALTDIDADVAALESRLTKARALKQAMAQALLTGRIRLVEPAP